MEDNSSLLVDRIPASSGEIELVSSVPMAAQPQSVEDTSVDISTDDPTIISGFTNRRHFRSLLDIGLGFSIWAAQGVLVFLMFRNFPNGINLCLIPFNLAFPFIVLNGMHCSSHFVIRVLFMLFSPFFATFAAVVVGAAFSPIAALLLPLLLVFFLFARLLQLIRRGDAYDNLVLFKFYIRTWIYYLYLYSIAPALAIFLVIACFSESLRKTLNHQFLQSWFLSYEGWSIYQNEIDDDSLIYTKMLYLQRICTVLSCVFIISTIFLILAFKFIPRVQLDLSESGINITEAVLEIADCGNAFLWMLVIKAPTKEYHKILGFEMWKWIRALIVIVIIQNVIIICTRMFVWLLQKIVCHDKPASHTDTENTRRSLILQKIFHKRYLVYWVNGIKRSMNFILTAVLFLLAWLLYFKPHLNLTGSAGPFWDFGIKTCLSILTCAILWLIKTCVILSWEAGSIYRRLESKILQGGKQLYYLGILGRCDYDIFSLLYQNQKPRKHENGGFIRLMIRLQHMYTFSFILDLDTHYRSKTDVVDEWQKEKKVSGQKMNRAKSYLLMQGDRTSTIFGLQQAALYFLMAKSKLLEENYTSDILQKLNSYNQDDSGSRSVEENLKRLISEENWNDFQEQLKTYAGSSESVSFQTRLNTWMEMAHSNCLVLANTLSSAKEVVDCLDNIICSVLIFATFIMWLLLTGLSTNEVLFLIATPLLAVTFIFQDTCKTLFEGIMFVYVVHPFNVGDLCIIDKEMLEVRTVGVWKTTLLKVSTQEEVIYSNSELSNKSIINHKTDFDWNDSIEFDVGSVSNEEIMNLKQDIEKFLDGDTGKFTPGYGSVEVSKTGHDFKLTVYLQHKVNLRQRTFFECLKEKRKLRSEFVLDTEKLAARYKNGETE